MDERCPVTPGSSHGPAFHESASALLRRMDVDSQRGLSREEAARRLQAVGPNRLRESRQRPPWRIALDQFQSPVVLLLLVAAAVAAGFGEFLEAVAIGGALLINALIGFGTEWRARQSMEALQRVGQMTATVRRSGAVSEIPARELVPGDIVQLSEGQVVPADLRVIAVENLQCDEAALTGESVPVAKNPTPVEDPRAPLSARHSMVFKGTAVTRGTAQGVVVGTGMDTEIGRVAALVEEARGELTPLERRLERLGKRLIYFVIAVGVWVILSGVVAGRDLFVIIETGIVLAIAAVPEGLPIVATVALGRGMWRMARRNALVKRLSAVETLGATTVICTDKTGTLTENRMAVRRVALPAGDVDMVREAHGAAFRRDARSVDPLAEEGLYKVLRVAALCTDAAHHEGRVTGDPTEVALLQAARGAGLRRAQLLRDLPEVRQESFDTATKKMATYHREGRGFLILVKGAPEPVIDACARAASPQGDVSALDPAQRRHWRERNEKLAGQGLRVLAVAEKRVAELGAEPYEDLVLLGLVGLYDPPRETVKAAIRRCRQAGIRVVMVTGDQPATAANIAVAVGIAEGAPPAVLTGRDLAAEGDRDGKRAARIRDSAIFARVAPEQKLRLVEIYQAYGEVVGMTGDGVNDAPALKKADIGIAMGRRGTEVAREASDIVLKDDAFETIVMAVEQGRAIFRNIRKFVVFLLSGNLGQIIGVSVAAVVNAPLPLLPLQILFLNLLLDVFPALALGVGPAEAGTLSEPPRDPKEPILTHGHWWAIAGFGVLMSAALLGVFAYALRVMGADTTTAVSMAFLTYGLARLWHAFNMRSPGTGVLRNEIVRNPYVWAAFALCGGLLLAGVYVPALAGLLKVVPLEMSQWWVVLGASLVPVILGQMALVVVAKVHGSSGRARGS